MKHRNNMYENKGGWYGKETKEAGEGDTAWKEG